MDSESNFHFVLLHCAFRVFKGFSTVLFVVAVIHQSNLWKFVFEIAEIPNFISTVLIAGNSPVYVHVLDIAIGNVFKPEGVIPNYNVDCSAKIRLQPECKD
ncbi:hypothetical protein TSUD_391030 [Trifolium subterraneum]|uniref:Uncharacterized protein n=1 Tax=Trifolium subterraneum TaxID=3900 RepID=A0A2Z6LX85_TRISU|nr:hypothetical protein TSUD_391030 [Trifolium subterraneum]